jgi:uncharacterized membrane protein YczE
MQHILALSDISLNRWSKLLLGLALFGTGITFMKQADLGLGPWEVLNDGISKMTGYQLGTVSIFIGMLVLILWVPIGERPGIGTLLNILLIGTVTNLTLLIIPRVDQIALQISWLVIGLLVIGLGSALYLGSRLGAGPRDGLMMGLYRRSGASIRLVRTILEISVLAVGWLLGGTIGIGTLAFALGIGPIIQFMFRLIGEYELAASRGKNKNL